MSTQYYLKSIPEKGLQLKISKRIRKSLLAGYRLSQILKILKGQSRLDNETVKVLNRGIRGPYANGYYCGFEFNQEFEFWDILVHQFPENGLLNIIFAEYLAQKDGNYERANAFYKLGFNIDFRLIGFIEPSWLSELIEKNFEFRLVYLRLQKEQYASEDFAELVDSLKRNHRNDLDKIKKIEEIANS